MATPGNYNNPEFQNADLTDHEKLALDEGHDADTFHGHTDDPEKGEVGKNASESSVAPKAAATDPNEVWWELPENEDPMNPQNWSSGKKWGNIALLSFVTLVTPLASSMFAPGVPAVLRDFHSESQLYATFVVSVYLIGFAFGPLVIAPLSELYGRYWIYTVCNVLFVIFAVACALSKNIGELIAFRLLHGIAGVAPLTIGGGTIADIMAVEKRGGAMAVWAMGPLLGPVFGPVAGGYLVEAKGWQWVFWILAIISGGATVMCFFILKETYPPTILEAKAKRLRKETGNPNLRSRLTLDIPAKELFRRAIIRPTKMLLFSPIVAIVCWYTAIAYGILYLLFTTFTFVFGEQYGFSPSTVGLTYIALGVGMMISLALMGTLSDKFIKQKQARGQQVKPEDRLPFALIVPGSLALPCGLFIYGWTVENKVHWIVPLIGTAIVGFGLLILFMCLQTYLIDAFTLYAASSIAANTVLRSLLGGLLPLSGLKMYDALGFGWGNSLLGFIALALAPVPILFVFYGEKIRQYPKFQVKL